MSFELAIISSLAGIALGLRYKVVILIRAVALVMMFAAVVGIVRGEPYWSIILAMAITGTAIQLGYLFGILVRAAVGKCSYYGMPKQPECAPGQKLSAPSVIVMARRGWTPLEQGSGKEPLAPAVQRRSTVRKEADEVESGRGSKSVPV